MKCLTIIRVLLSRVLFSIYCGFCVFVVTLYLSDVIYWLLLIPAFPLFLETIRAAKNWNSKNIEITAGSFKFFPSVFFYLSCAIPCIWVLQLNCGRGDLGNGSGTLCSQLNPVDIDTIFGTLQQILILFLVLGKWIAPNDLSVEEQARLLLMYIATGADIVNILALANSDQFEAQREIFEYVILSVWTLSVLRFTFVTVKKDESKQEEEPEDEEGQSASQRLTTALDTADQILSNTDCCGTLCETIDAVLDIFTQDAPFLGIRLSSIIVLGSIPDELLFYLAKNGLVIAINIYRIIGNFMEKGKGRRVGR